MKQNWVKIQTMFGQDSKTQYKRYRNRSHNTSLLAVNQQLQTMQSLTVSKDVAQAQETAVDEEDLMRPVGAGGDVEGRPAELHDDGVKM